MRQFRGLECGMMAFLHVQVPGLGIFRLSPFRLVWRSITVFVITVRAAAELESMYLCNKQFAHCHFAQLVRKLRQDGNNLSAI